MKTPQPRFVVEFKSGRRKSKAQTNSIWGDTDFKALAREVEGTAPHLFDSHEAPGTADSGETGSVDPINAEAVNERASDVEAAPAAPLANGAQVEISKHHEASYPAEAVAQVQESQPASQPGTPSPSSPLRRAKRAADRTIARTSKVGHEGRKEQAGTVDNPISLDELAALDADNKRLKGLLAEHLRAQNLWLKKMLERFDVE